MALADQIDDLLPQTQCTQCGFSGCRPYAEAIARGEAQINQCPPGGAQVIARLAALLDRTVIPLNPANGIEKPLAAALIDEQWCIGCTLCIQACPVDAIVGAAKRMHTVLLEQCTGCELCVAPCPVDCIEIISRTSLIQRGAQISLDGPAAQDSRSRYLAWQSRRAHQGEENRAMPAQKARAQRAAYNEMQAAEYAQRKRAAIEAALQRARARRSGG